MVGWNFILQFIVTVAVAAPPEKLSETGLYQDIQTKTVAASNRLFVPQYPLWSDGLKKQRWIFLPDNHTIDTQNFDEWKFPKGTKFWKEFATPTKRIETRLIEKTEENKWEYATYVWNEAETDAMKAPIAGIKDVAEIAPGIKHNIPSGFDCRRCHNQRNNDVVLGFDALQLSGVQFETLIREQRLSHVPDAFKSHPPQILATSEIGKAALGYLHGNCGNCHNPNGTADNTGLFFKHTNFTLTPEQEPGFATSVNQLTTSFQIPGQTETFRVLPREPLKSAIFFRMNSRLLGISMPPVGSKMIDPQAVELIKKWIDGF